MHRTDSRVSHAFAALAEWGFVALWLDPRRTTECLQFRTRQRAQINCFSSVTCSENGEITATSSVKRKRERGICSSCICRSQGA